MINRDSYINKIRPFFNTDIIKVLTGIRRSGKSVMLELIKKEFIDTGITPNQFITINFEQMSKAHLRTAESLYAELSRQIQEISGKAYIFLDEIQEVQEWERVVNSIRVEFDCDIYITGSNSHLLSGELATYLAGRYVEFTIYPFSFHEFVLLHQQTEPQANISELFRKYLQLGGMPFLANLPSNREAAILYLRDVYNSVILKDVLRRNNIRDVDLLERIALYVLSNIGHSFSANSIVKFFKSEHRKVATDTILNYIKACSEAFLFYKVSREDIIGKKLLSVNEKYYTVDHGVREAILDNNMMAIDQVLENIVYIELLRRGYRVYVGKNDTKEIDFVATKHNEKIYIQVTYLLASPETVQREFGAYDGVPDHFPKYVISMDELDFSQNGVRHLNIKDFLLSDKI